MCKRVYKVKHYADGLVNMYKKRLIAKVYAQTFIIDYKKLYSLVAKMTIVKESLLWQ